MQKGLRKRSSLGNTTEGTAACCSRWNDELHADEPSSHTPQEPNTLLREGKPICSAQSPARRWQGRRLLRFRGWGPSVAVLHSGRRMQQESCQSSAGTLAISLPGWAAPYRELHLQTGCLHRATELR